MRGDGALHHLQKARVALSPDVFCIPPSSNEFFFWRDRCLVKRLRHVLDGMTI